MIGFFEHQYLKFKKSHLSNLIALAMADGQIHEHELKLIYRIGEKYKLKEKQIQKLLDSPNRSEIYIPESHEHKMEQLYDLIRMVYADGVVEELEVTFCENVMDLFGYKKEIVRWLIEIFKNEHRPLGTEWEKLVQIAKDKYLQ
jgi:uncharacterized tellurite resistance protein B-like protein